MDLRRLNDALVLLEEQNITRAAARQNISQSAFSRRIRSFEDWLGTSVLDRGTNRVGISPALRNSEAEIHALTERIHGLRSYDNLELSHFRPSRTWHPTNASTPEPEVRVQSFVRQTEGADWPVRHYAV